MNKTRIAIIALVLILLALVVWVSYKNRSILNYSAKKILDKQVRYPFIDGANNILYYYNTQENPGIFALNLKNNENKQITKDMPGISNIQWSQNFDKVLIQVIYDTDSMKKANDLFYNPGLATGDKIFWVYSVSNQQLLPLTEDIQNITWLSNDKLIYNTYDSNNNISIFNTINAAGKNNSYITELGYPIDYLLGYQNATNSLYYVATPSEYDGTQIFRLDLNGKKAESLISIVGADEGGQAVLFEGANIMLYNSLSDKYNSLVTYLYKIDKKQGTLIDASLDLSGAIYDSKYKVIYCLQFQNNSNNIVKLDTSSGKFKKIYIKSQPDLIQEIMLSGDSKTLYFTSQNILYNFKF